MVSIPVSVQVGRCSAALPYVDNFEPNGLHGAVSDDIVTAGIEDNGN